MRRCLVVLSLLSACIAVPALGAIPVLVKVAASSDSGANKYFQDAVSSGIKAALRRLGDIQVVDNEDAASLVIDVAVTTFRDPESGATVGLALGVTYEAVIHAVQLTAADNLWIERSVKEGCADIDGMRSHFGRARYWRVAVYSWVLPSAPSLVDQSCSKIVTFADTSFIESLRSQSRE